MSNNPQTWKEIEAISTSYEESALIPEGLAIEFFHFLSGESLGGITCDREKNEVTVMYDGEEVALFVFDIETVNVILTETNEDVSVEAQHVNDWALSLCQSWRAFIAAEGLVMDSDFVFESDSCAFTVGGILYCYNTEKKVFTKPEGSYSLNLTYQDLNNLFSQIRSSL